MCFRLALILERVLSKGWLVVVGQDDLVDALLERGLGRLDFREERYHDEFGRLHRMP